MGATHVDHGAFGMLPSALLTGLKDWGCLTEVFELHAHASSAQRSVLKKFVTGKASRLAMELAAELMVVEYVASSLATYLLPKLGIVRKAELVNL